MNSEELEQSLRTEFESYLKDVLADMQQEVSGFQTKLNEEFESQRSRLEELFKGFAEKVGEGQEIDSGFKESVAEHLKLARDEGAKITAAAIAEAEEMREEDESSGNFSDLRDAINEISGNDTQSDILKALVHHASKYTPRGAFFIVKNSHLVGWRLFGTEEHPNPDDIREVYFPIVEKTTLKESIDSLATVESSFGVNPGDELYLEKLGYGEPGSIYTIPLVVRGRGVAALYADRGMEDSSVNVEALEALMKVAGMTVELLASGSQRPVDVAPADEAPADEPAEEAPESFDAAPDDPADEPEGSNFEHVDTDASDDSWAQPVESFEADSGVEVEEVQSFGDVEVEAPVQEVPAFGETELPENEFRSNIDESLEADVETSYEAEPSPNYEPESSSGVEFNQDPAMFDQQPEVSPEPEAEVESEFDSSDAGAEVNVENFESTAEVSDFEDSAETTGYETSQLDATEFSEAVTEQPAEEEVSYEAEPAEEEVVVEETAAVEEAPAAEEVEAAQAESESAPRPRSRFGDRNVDLPIEVEDEERRYHNDARRFARLLVSEIKLYNEQKVKEGRESADLYERLREAIDRSREMYDKRVQPPVAAKFDYFNYEIVNTLAEGDEGKLGRGYPGATV